MIGSVVGWVGFVGGSEGLMVRGGIAGGGRVDEDSGVEPETSGEEFTSCKGFRSSKE